jgi:hypothetical protein
MGFEISKSKKVNLNPTLRTIFKSQIRQLPNARMRISENVLSDAPAIIATKMNCSRGLRSDWVTGNFRAIEVQIATRLLNPIDKRPH